MRQNYVVVFRISKLQVQNQEVISLFQGFERGENKPATDGFITWNLEKEGRTVKNCRLKLDVNY